MSDCVKTSGFPVADVHVIAQEGLFAVFLLAFSQSGVGESSYRFQPVPYQALRAVACTYLPREEMSFGSKSQVNSREEAD